jgi:hypothetical protein
MEPGPPVEAFQRVSVARREAPMGGGEEAGVRGATVREGGRRTMIRKFWRRVSWPIVFAGLMAPLAVHCGGSMPGASGLPGVPGVAGKCPDMSKADAIDTFDFEHEFNLKAEVAAKIKAGAAAAAEMQALDTKIDSDLTTACSNLAKDLGEGGSFKDAQEACKAANKAIVDVKAKLGPKAEIRLDMSEPHCGVDVSVYGDCAAHCDATVKPGSAEVKCEPGKLQGQCSAQCQGDCEVSGGAECSGECDGSCDAEIKGGCGGNCQGKCDGKATPAGGGAQCAGTCDGKCSGNVKAVCKGKCGGSCHLNASASCKGTCSGSCSAQMQAPKCTGKVEPPQMSAECKAKCDAKVDAHAECTPPHLAVRIVGAADSQVAAKFQAVIEKDLPAVVTVSVGMAKHVEELASTMKVVVEGVEATVKTAGDPGTVMRLTGCVAAPFKGALDAVANVKANVNVSISVQASASASGSAKAG